jgi:hypothetical protein
MSEKLEAVGRFDDLFKALAEQERLNGWEKCEFADGSRRVGKGSGYLMFFVAVRPLFQFKHHTSIAYELQAASFRKGESSVIEKRGALRRFKSGIDSEGHVRDGIRDLLRISISGPEGPRDRILKRIEQIVTCEASHSAERSIDQLVADLKATRALLWKPMRSFTGSLALLARSLGRVPTKGEVADRLIADFQRENESKAPAKTPALPSSQGVAA